MSQPWRQLRDLEPPLGSKQRVLERIEDRRAAPRRARAFMWAAPIAAVAVVAWLVVPVERTPTPTAVRPEPVEGPQGGGGAIQLGSGDTMDLTLSTAAVSVTGPASIRATTADAVTLDDGDAHVDGTATIRGARCEARVDGRADVTVTTSRMQVRIYAGTAEITSLAPETTCTVLQTTELPPTPTPTPPPPPPPLRSRSASPPPPPPPPASPLRRQVDAFRAARAQAARDPAAALTAYRALRDTYPDTPLREEIDAAIVDALVALDRTDDARAAAAAFAARYPRSVRADAMRALAEEPP